MWRQREREQHAVKGRLMWDLIWGQLGCLLYQVCHMTPLLDEGSAVDSSYEFGPEALEVDQSPCD